MAIRFGGLDYRILPLSRFYWMLFAAIDHDLEVQVIRIKRPFCLNCGIPIL